MSSSSREARRRNRKARMEMTVDRIVIMPATIRQGAKISKLSAQLGVLSKHKSQDGKKVATLRRSLSELRGFWTYLQSIEAAPENSLPFDKLTVPKPPKNGSEEERAPSKPPMLLGCTSPLWSAMIGNWQT